MPRIGYSLFGLLSVTCSFALSFALMRIGYNLKQAYSHSDYTIHWYGGAGYACFVSGFYLFIMTITAAMGGLVGGRAGALIGALIGILAAWGVWVGLGILLSD